MNFAVSRAFRPNRRQILEADEQAEGWKESSQDNRYL